VHAPDLNDGFARFVINRMPAALSVYDAEGHLIYSNTFARRLLGLDDEEMSSRTASDDRWQTVHEDGSPFVPDEYPINVSLRTGQRVEEVAMGVQRPDGSTSWLLVNSEPIFDVRAGFSRPAEAGPHTDEKPSAVVAIFLDITDRMHLRNQLQESQKLDAVGKLAAGVAHDLRNMLQAITSSCEVIARRNGGENIRSQIDVIRDATRRGGELTHQLLAVARRQKTRPMPMNLRDAIQSNVKLLQPMIGKGIELRTRVAPCLWPIHADPSVIAQVIMNLVLNARDAMPRGGVIEIAAFNFNADAVGRRRNDFPHGDCVVLSVTDSGTGIAPENIGRIFDPYFTTKAEHGGHSGLGLAVVHGIVQQQRGKIWVESGPGLGASFNISFPRYVG
jgi:PAS domain S-box-containing protein